MSADDLRNSKMSDLAQENDSMSQALYEIIEIYAGLEGFRCDTPAEFYLEKMLRDAYLIASKASRNLP